ncbi:MAG: RNA 2',3'-cyclic phosphodiesterase [Rhodospirillales bacterium]
MLRLFVGIPLPDDIRRDLAGLCTGLPGARWVDAAMMHLTLRFIGEVDGGLADDLHDELTRLVAPGFRLELSGVDCFSTSGKAHTLWTGVAKEPLLVHLRDKVERALVRAGIEPERRKFKPHVTLARFRNGAPDRLGGYFQRYSRFASEPFLVDRFALFRSRLGSEGAHYEVLAEYLLRWGATPESPLEGSAPVPVPGS